MDFSTQKDEVKRKILQKVISSLENNTLNEAELPLIGDFVLRIMNTVRNEEDLKIFLIDFTKYWPMLADLDSPTPKNQVLSNGVDYPEITKEDLKKFALRLMEVK